LAFGDWADKLGEAVLRCLVERATGDVAINRSRGDDDQPLHPVGVVLGDVRIIEGDCV
jgi:hypothetical protein